MTLDEALPTYDFDEVHNVRVEAPAERAASAEQVTLADIPVAAALLHARTLPAFIAGRPRPTLTSRRPMRELLESGGFTAMDQAARRSFARYWRVIRPFSGLIRIVWLRAAKRRAEAVS